MSSPPRDRDELLALIDDVVARELASEMMLFQSAVADWLGLNLSDFNCAGILRARGALTAGQLAEATGLTSGAITGVIDRLEKAGFVRREPDPADRRRVVVVPVNERFSQVPELYRSLGETMTRMSMKFSDGELAAIVDYINVMIGVLHSETLKLRGTMAGPRGAEPPGDAAPAAKDAMPHAVSAPLGNETEGQADFLSGITGVTILGAPLPGLLYRASAAGSSRPDVRVRGGRMSVQLGWHSWLGGSGDATFTLNSDIPWQVSSRGNIGQATIDLRQIILMAFRAQGGIDRAKVLLGQPRGAVQVEVRGNVSRAAFVHPPDAAVTLRVHGNVYKLHFGTQSFDALAGHVSLQTPGASGAANRFDILVRGNVSELAIQSW